MTVHDTDIKGVVLIEPQVFGDERGYFFESYNQAKYEAVIGVSFVQDNESHSVQHILRGLHAQRAPHAQGKLVRVVSGEVLDVVVDARPDSATFAQHVSVILSDENKKQLWIPPGCAHGFVVRSPQARFLYKCTEHYAPESEVTLRWNDPTLGIDWQCETPNVNERDAAGLEWADFCNALQGT